MVQAQTLPKGITVLIVGSPPLRPLALGRGKQVKWESEMKRFANLYGIHIKIRNSKSPSPNPLLFPHQNLLENSILSIFLPALHF
jgi:hypothetical protein